MDAEEWREERERRREGAAEERVVTTKPATTKPEQLESIAKRALRIQRYQKLPPTVGAAKSYGMPVFAAARDADATEEQLSGMRARMNAWVKYLAQYELDVAEIKSNNSFTERQRADLLETLCQNRAEHRRELFGE